METLIRLSAKKITLEEIDSSVQKHGIEARKTNDGYSDRVDIIFSEAGHDWCYIAVLNPDDIIFDTEKEKADFQN